MFYYKTEIYTREFIKTIAPRIENMCGMVLKFYSFLSDFFTQNTLCINVQLNKKSTDYYVPA